MLNWGQSDDPLLNGINSQITPPSPLHLASSHGELPWRLQLAHFPSPRGKSAVATCEEVGGGSLEWRLGLAHFHNEYSFLMISPKLHDFSLLFLLIPSPF
jgi:hypothetical protein